MAIASLSDLVNRMSGGASGAPETIWFTKTVRQAGVNATVNSVFGWYSLWKFDGTPSGGVAPGAVSVPTNATAGGLQQTDAAGGNTKYLLQFAFGDVSQYELVLYDRLLHVSGLSATVTTAQTVGGALTRYTNGLGNQIFIEIYTQIGASAQTITASYTNDAGVAGRTTAAVAFGGTNNREISRFIYLPLAAGDRGVQSVQSVTVSGTTGTAGDFGVTIVHPLAFCESGNGSWATYRDLNVAFPGPVTIPAGACLALAIISHIMNNNAPLLVGAVSFVDA